MDEKFSDILAEVGDWKGFGRCVWSTSSRGYSGALLMTSENIQGRSCTYERILEGVRLQRAGAVVEPKEMGMRKVNWWRARSCHHQAKWGLVRCHRLGHQVQGCHLGPDVIVIQPTTAVIDPDFFVIKIPSTEMVGMGQYILCTKVALLLSPLM